MYDPPSTQAAGARKATEALHMATMATHVRVTPERPSPPDRGTLGRRQDSRSFIGFARRASLTRVGVVRGAQPGLARSTPGPGHRLDASETRRERWAIHATPHTTFHGRHPTDPSCRRTPSPPRSTDFRSGAAPRPGILRWRCCRRVAAEPWTHPPVLAERDGWVVALEGCVQVHPLAQSFLKGRVRSGIGDHHRCRDDGFIRAQRRS